MSKTYLESRVNLMTPTNVAAFWQKVVKSEGCWVWVGAKTSPSGYGRFGIQRVMYVAHRVAYELSFGPIEAHMEIDHICSNRACVRPDHLRMVTPKQNSEHRKVVATNTSGHRGVSWCVRDQVWVSYVTHAGQRIFLGNFASAEAAGEAARLARLGLFTHNDEDKKIGSYA